MAQYLPEQLGFLDEVSKDAMSSEEELVGAIFRFSQLVDVL